ncbi:MAG: sensor histidine kinase [Lachnospiraceae bacterium]
MQKVLRGKTINLSMFQKFAITFIVVGLLPMLLLSIFISMQMINEYKKAMIKQYTNATVYVSESVVTMIDQYNTISKMPYYYNFDPSDSIAIYLSYDHFRKIIYGENYEPENLEEYRRRDMDRFLLNIGTTDSNIVGTHFIGLDLENNKFSFHRNNSTNFIRSETVFENAVKYDEIDKTSKHLILIPTHSLDYFISESELAFTVARNYFDLRGQVGDTKYVGTLFLDINLQEFEKLYSSLKLKNNEVLYVTDQNGICFYSNNENLIGKDITEQLQQLGISDSELKISTEYNKYGLAVTVSYDAEEALLSIKKSRDMISVAIILSAAALFAASILFSRRLTQPIHQLMHEMEKIETGNFDIDIPVESTDEIGILSDRFNQMSKALKSYINKYYLAQIKQNEAELTALKSQIYPHFLYNTLEIIRMTSLEEKDDSNVPIMIEALSEQIHYLIGPMKDMVSIAKELDIVKKYIYLLNCRINGKVALKVESTVSEQILIPKLILQPIIENAYMHGLKPKNGVGTILIEMREMDGILSISVLDNGIGMSQKKVDELYRLLESDEIGIKNEFDWQSIGLKNVSDRLKLLYGEEFGIEITSTVKVGTMIRIIMPLTVRDRQCE